MDEIEKWVHERLVELGDRYYRLPITLTDERKITLAIYNYFAIQLDYLTGERTKRIQNETSK